VIEIEEQRRGGGEVLTVVRHLDREPVRLAIAQHARERGHVDAIGDEVEGLRRGDRTPEERVHSAR